MKQYGFQIFVFTIFCLNAASGNQNLSPTDPSSFSRPDLVVLKHAILKYDVEFNRKVLKAEAILNFVVKRSVDEIILDVRDLVIETIELVNGPHLNYTVGEAVAGFGSKLTIQLSRVYDDNDELNIAIRYKTSPTASALHWLEPSQTSGKQHPYLFSLSLPIHARSILPCQDTPQVKFTYEAEVVAPPEYTVLMSALRSEPEGNVTRFRQPIPIPSYLLTIVVGLLESRRLSPRSLVWSEKAEVEKSAWEFSDTEKYLQTAEAFCGPYEWTQYDLLVLPPSFAYGGMENPCLTYVTPTLLAGDKSLTPVIIHEISHSWTGNLVSIKNFEHFWLKEGFTVFLEGKIGASFLKTPDESRKDRDFHSLLGLEELKDTIQVLGETNPITKLVVNLTALHPSDAFSTVPYEKGALFLRYLEDTLSDSGNFDDFVRSYIKQFRMQSIDTDQFKSCLIDYYKNSTKLNEIDWDKWFNAPGMPPVIPDYDTSMTKVIDDLVLKIKNEVIISEVLHEAGTFNVNQIIHFLQKLLDIPPLSINILQALGDGLQLNNTKNAEIEFRWLRLCIRSNDYSKIPAAFDFVNRQGRMKYITPIYRMLYEWEEVRQDGINNFIKNEKYMMHVAARSIRKVLHLPD